MIIRQLTDVHIRAPGSLAYGRVDTNRFLNASVKELAALIPAPDVFVMTGDLTDFGRTDEYASLAEGVARLSKRGAAEHCCFTCCRSCMSAPAWRSRPI